ncbi:IS6 family transposase [Mycoplasmatota bacterium WC44]
MKDNLFKWKHYQHEIIILCVRWYLKYPLSYRNLQEMMEERGLYLNHTTIYRWVIEYSPILNRNLRKHLRKTNDSWRMDETYLKFNGEWMYLYRAVDSKGDTIDFWLSKKRDKRAAKKFFRKALRSPHNSNPRVITTDKYAATISTIKNEIKLGKLNPKTKHRSSKYMNNIVEQDHRHIKRITNNMLGFKHFKSACSTIQGVEAMNMIRKGQANTKKTVDEINLVNQLFGVA